MESRSRSALVSYKSISSIVSSLLYFRVSGTRLSQGIPLCCTFLCLSILVNLMQRQITRATWILVAAFRFSLVLSKSSAYNASSPHPEVVDWGSIDNINSVQMWIPKINSPFHSYFTFGVHFPPTYTQMVLYFLIWILLINTTLFVSSFTFNVWFPSTFSQVFFRLFHIYIIPHRRCHEIITSTNV